MYKDLFDQKHRIHEVLLQPINQIKSKMRQSGVYDTNILCGNCDNKVLGRLERYASLVLYGGIELTIESMADRNKSSYVKVNGIDYRMFKLFLLSILWRASVSNLPIFKNVNLGIHEQVIRRKILDNNPGSAAKYPCAIFTHLHNHNIPYQIIVEPAVVINGEQQIYAFLISGNLFVFFTATDTKTEWVQDCTINENGGMKIIQMSEGLSTKAINKLLGIDLL